MSSSEQHGGRGSSNGGAGASSQRATDPAVLAEVKALMQGIESIGYHVSPTASLSAPPRQLGGGARTSPSDPSLTASPRVETTTTSTNRVSAAVEAAAAAAPGSGPETVLAAPPASYPGTESIASSGINSENTNSRPASALSYSATSQKQSKRIPTWAMIAVAVLVFAAIMWALSTIILRAQASSVETAALQAAPSSSRAPGASADPATAGAPPRVAWLEEQRRGQALPQPTALPIRPAAAAAPVTAVPAAAPTRLAPSAGTDPEAASSNARALAEARLLQQATSLSVEDSLAILEKKRQSVLRAKATAAVPSSEPTRNPRLTASASAARGSALASASAAASAAVVQEDEQEYEEQRASQSKSQSQSQSQGSSKPRHWTSTPARSALRAASEDDTQYEAPDFDEPIFAGSNVMPSSRPPTTAPARRSVRIAPSAVGGSSKNSVAATTRSKAAGTHDESEEEEDEDPEAARAKARQRMAAAVAAGAAALEAPVTPARVSVPLRSSSRNAVPAAASQIAFTASVPAAAHKARVSSGSGSQQSRKGPSNKSPQRNESDDEANDRKPKETFETRMARIAAERAANARELGIPAVDSDASADSR